MKKLCVELRASLELENNQTVFDTTNHYAPITLFVSAEVYEDLIHAKALRDEIDQRLNTKQ